jgi:hypothetical protein
MGEVRNGLDECGLDECFEERRGRPLVGLAMNSTTANFEAPG